MHGSVPVVALCPGSGWWSCWVGCFVCTLCLGGGSQFPSQEGQIHELPPKYFPGYPRKSTGEKMSPIDGVRRVIFATDKCSPHSTPPQMHYPSIEEPPPRPCPTNRTIRVGSGVSVSNGSRLTDGIGVPRSTTLPVFVLRGYGVRAVGPE